ncbi:hypothetical protein AHAS_Ahas11G0135800 [Arachis hypogaea]
MTRTKTTSRRPSTAPPDTGTSRVNAANCKKPITEEEPHMSPPPRSSSRPQGRSIPKATSIQFTTLIHRPFLQSVKKSYDSNPIGFKSHFGEALDYYDIVVNAYTFGKWDNDMDISHKDVLDNICVNNFLMEGVTPNHRSLGPVRALLHRIITHILLPQINKVVPIKRLLSVTL